MNKLVGFRTFLRDRTFAIVGFIITELLIFLLLIAFKTNSAAIVAVLIIFAVFFVLLLAIDYWRRRGFYRALVTNLAQLEQAYLILETLEQPGFYDGRILYEALYAVDKSMIENVKRYRDESRAFREFIELWIHEVKTPLTTLSLMNHDPRAAAQLRRLDDFVDQVLFFSRAENAEHDYLVGKTLLADVVHEVALRNQPLLLGKAIDFSTQNLDLTVYTDARWLGFIIGQIMNNSIKYGATKITISATSTAEGTKLSIADNGIGIDPKDLPRVFEKSFTGQNGHLKRTNKSESSTGMGLYIVKTLCDKLGHQIKISSEPNKSTTVGIIFANHDYYLTRNQQVSK